MKKTGKNTLLLILIILITTLFIGCSMLEGILATPEITARIAAFEAALNFNPRSAETIALNFAPVEETVMRENIEIISFWDTNFDPDYSYDFEIISTLDVTAVEAVMTATLIGTDTADAPVDVTFKMYKDPVDGWLIEEYYEGSNAIVRLIDNK